eukprot:CAMPEP_0116011706 /NCGR_PEP_ID=MMETSP0321-20121206/4714_1 /TAXON_ID=163516 /ORGANISM="Leptocylindrus danicus var. danicus, Strain B650" /LENGTH=621 /DNA_ID=CAMNT_0003480963 /DNA_START=20 /DNA_END=1882 /DNA_ORIENTATION=+
MKKNHQKRGPAIERAQEKQRPISLPLWFVALSLFILPALSFFAGRVAKRFIILENSRGEVAQDCGDDGATLKWQFNQEAMPHIVGYTSKVFENENVKLSKTAHAKSEVATCIEEQDNQCMIAASNKNVANAVSIGKHMLVDIEYVNSDFLDDETQLAQALVSSAKEARATLLSYHCHSMIPKGVTCTGIMPHGHISFHTWPDSGVILMDLYLSSSESILLVPGLSILEKNFAIPRASRSVQKPEQAPKLLWKQKQRGFDAEKDDNFLDDLFDVLDSFLPYKIQVPSVESLFQRIDIYDYIDGRFQSLESYEKSLEENGTYESLNPKLFLPSREVFLDGVLQSTRDGDEAYHEALVHPGMFTHSNPERVVIIGGGEGGTLREVLKHKSVKNVKMVEIDEIMTDISRKYLPFMNDCSDSKGSRAHCCFDDDRADVIFKDATEWLLDEFGDTDGPMAKMWASRHDEEDVEELLDVIVMDVLDPMFVIPEFADKLYSSGEFMQTLFDALKDDGVLIMQLGISPSSGNTDEYNSPTKQRSEVIDIITVLGFQSMHLYEEAHCEFNDPWSFLVACKDASCQRNFYRNEAEFELAIHKRIFGSHSGAPPHKFFDGSTMKNYQVPPRSW